jgi:hypothetical protein
MTVAPVAKESSCVPKDSIPHSRAVISIFSPSWIESRTVIRIKTMPATDIRGAMAPIHRSIFDHHEHLLTATLSW